MIGGVHVASQWEQHSAKLRVCCHGNPTHLYTRRTGAREDTRHKCRGPRAGMQYWARVGTVGCAFVRVSVTGDVRMALTALWRSSMAYFPLKVCISVKSNPVEQIRLLNCSLTRSKNRLILLILSFPVQFFLTTHKADYPILLILVWKVGCRGCLDRGMWILSKSIRFWR